MQSRQHICWWFIAATLSLSVKMAGQTDTSILIPTVEVTAGKIPTDSDFRLSHGPDSMTLALAQGSSFAAILPFSSDAYLRSYSPGGLSTLSLRGTGGGHTPVIWNGLNLRHPMNGTTDYALYPVWLLDEVVVQTGSAAPYQGNGLVGGGVLLEDRLRIRDGSSWHAGSVAGSFGTYAAMAKAEYQQGRHGGTARYIHQQATNDYPLPVSPPRRQENAGMRQDAMTLQYRFRPDSTQVWSVYTWLQQADRHIPPTLTEANVSARQQDRIIRTAVRWKQDKTKSTTTAVAGISRDEILYFSLLTDSTRSISSLLQSDVRHSRRLSGGGSIETGYQFVGQRAVAPTTGDRLRGIHTLHSMLKLPLPLPRTWFQVSAQSTVLDRQLKPLGGIIALHTALWKHIGWMASLNRSFSFPTFNDLYWQDAFSEGNPGLLPEQSNGISSGLTWRPPRAARHTGMIQVSVSDNRVRDWILWEQSDHRWRPENKRSVRARSLSANVSHAVRLSSDFSLRYHAGFACNRSTVTAVYDQRNTRQIGKQLIYTPVWTGYATFSFLIRHATLQFQTQWVGKRQTTSDNYQALALAPYWHGNLVAQRVFRLGEHGNLTLAGTVHNLWDATIETIAERMMPGRHYQFSILLGQSR